MRNQQSSHSFHLLSSKFWYFSGPWCLSIWNIYIYIYQFFHRNLSTLSDNMWLSTCQAWRDLEQVPLSLKPNSPAMANNNFHVPNWPNCAPKLHGSYLSHTYYLSLLKYYYLLPFEMTGYFKWGLTLGVGLSNG